MTEMMRVKVRWSGFSGAPGYSVLHFRDFGAEDGGGGPVSAAACKAAADKAYAGFVKIQTLLPSAVRLNVENEVEVIEDTTGDLVNAFGIVAPIEIAGTSSTTWSRAAGASINWKTGGIRNARRVRGRTFLVPLSGGAFGADGGLTGSAVTQINGMANTLADTSTTPDLGVYARPTGPGATDGFWTVVSSGSASAKGAILRSRRD